MQYNEREHKHQLDHHMKTLIRPIIYLIITSTFNFTAAVAQENSPFLSGPNGLSLLINIFQPTGAVYFETAKDNPNELDLFRDGGTSFDIRLIGIELQKTITGKNATAGVRAGFGVGKSIPDPANEIREAGIFVWGRSAFFKAGQTASFEIGWLQGISAQEDLTRKGRTDAALFMGINFQTAFTEKLNTLMSKL